MDDILPAEAAWQGLVDRDEATFLDLFATEPDRPVVTLLPRASAPANGGAPSEPAEPKSKRARNAAAAQSLAEAFSTPFMEQNEKEAFPHLSKYLDSLAKPKPKLKKTLKRYFKFLDEDFDDDGTRKKFSDDGHPERDHVANLCIICLKADCHPQWCPHARCRACFRRGHVAFECPDIFRSPIMAQGVMDVLSEATAVAGPRCVGCGSTDAGHLNCAIPPDTPFVRSQEPMPEKEDYGHELRGFDLDASFTHWSHAGPWPHVGCGAGLGHEFDGSLLRRLQRMEDLAEDAPEDSVSRFVSLRQMGAILHEPGAPPTLSSFGAWLGSLSLPPVAAAALFHGALWHALLPMAILVVAGSSMLPAMLLTDNGKAGEHRSHHALLELYFQARQGETSGSVRSLVPTAFWEMLDARITAVMKHAQQALSYRGEDAAFDEMDGDLMDVRRRDAQPWTLAASVGREQSERRARFLAALCAVFPPTFCSRRGVWTTRMSISSEEGAATLETVLDSSYAVLFAEGLEASGALLVVGNVRGTLFGGAAALEEATALRSEYRTALLEKFDYPDEIDTSCPEEHVSRALGFLRAPSSELVGPSLQGSGSEDLDVQALFAKIPKPAVAAVAPSMGSGGPPVISQVAPPSVSAWGLAFLKLALARSLKQRASEDENYALAADWKDKESAMSAEISVNRKRVLDLGGPTEATLENLAKRKRKAIEDEDFVLAQQLKDEEATLMSNSGARDELEKVLKEKQRAVEEEDFDRAAQLKEREAQLRDLARDFEAEALALAFSLAKGRTLPEWSLAEDDPVWDEVQADLCADAHVAIPVA